jgi:dTDP-glucose 4,6-dehydratase
VLTPNCLNNYGAYHALKIQISLCRHNALTSKKLRIYGESQQTLDWLYVQDHCAAIVPAVKNGKIRSTYDIRGCNQIKNLQVVTFLCGILDKLRLHKDGQPYTSTVIFLQDSPNYDRYHYILVTKINSGLGLQPAATFTACLKKAVQRRLEN